MGEKTGPNSTGRGKRGVRRSVLSDGRGVPIGLAIAGADVDDPLLMRKTLDAVPVARPRPAKRTPRHLHRDKGFDYAAPRDLAEAFAFTLHLPPSRCTSARRGEEIQTKRHRGAKARRRVVERARAWLDRFRGIRIRWPRKPQNDRALLHCAGASIAFQQTLPR